MQPKVSMVMPCYNKKKQISRMLESVYNQLWDNIELILVNDGSTDGTREIISDWEPRLRERGFDVVIIDQENQGVAVAVYTGLCAITGEYLCIVDCDDELHSNYVLKMAQYLCEHSDCEWTSCNYHEVGEKNGETFFLRKDLKPANSIYNYMLLNGQISVWPHLIRTSYFNSCRVLDYYVTDTRLTQEPQIMVPLFCANGKIGKVDEALYYYNMDSGHLWGSTVEKRADFFACYFSLVKSMLQKLDANISRKKQLLQYAEFCECRILLSAPHYSRNDLLKRIYHVVKNKALINDWIKTYDTSDGWVWLFVDRLTKWALREKSYDIDFKEFESIVIYGALGRMAGKCIRYLLQFLPSQPILWDQNAEGEIIFDLECVKPSFASLPAKTAIIVLPLNPQIIQRVSEQAGATMTVINISEIRSYIGGKLFPTYCNEWLELERG